MVNVCGGDLGQPQIQKFDIETWMPSRDGYGETHSASRFHDFQARRLNLRYRDAEGKVRFCHTLNNTVAASARMLIALLENHQERDGTRAHPALAATLHGRARGHRAPARRVDCAPFWRETPHRRARSPSEFGVPPSGGLVRRPAFRRDWLRRRRPPEGGTPNQTAVPFTTGID